MRILPITNISFQKLGMHTENNFKVFDDLGHPSNYENSFGMYNISAKHDARYDIYYINVNSDALEEPVSVLKSSVNKDHIYVDYMQTKNGYRNQGLGGKLHMLNIIEMLENGYSEMYFEAVPTAIPYHAKFKFYPDAKWNDRLPRHLSDACNFDESFYQQFCDLKKSKLTNKEKEVVGNKILNNFLQKAVKEHSYDDLKYVFSTYLDMKITKDDIIKNKDFYNAMFRKYNIDYEI